MQVLLFDVDATLIRTGGAGMQAMDQAFAEVMGWQGAIAAISPAGRTDPSIAHEISINQRGCPMSAGELATVFDCYLRRLALALAQAPDFRVLPGIRQFLDKMKPNPGILLGLGTGNLESGARLKLQRGELEKYFNFGGYGSDALDRNEVLRIAWQRAVQVAGRSLDPRDGIVIGDTPHDIAAGKALGARTLAVATGPFDEKQLLAHQPDWVISDFTQTNRLAEIFAPDY